MKKRIVLILFFCFSSSLFAQKNNDLHKLFEDYFEASLQLNPLKASAIGDHRYDHLYPNAISVEHRQKSRVHYQNYLNRLSNIDYRELSDEDRLSYDLLQYDLQIALAGREYPSHLLPINQMYAAPAMFAKLGSGADVHLFKTTKDYDNFLQRIDGFCIWVETAISNMQEGIARGIVQPRLLIEKTLPQLQAHLPDDPEESVFYKPIRNMPDSIPEADRRRLTQTYRTTIIEKIFPAYRELHDFLRDGYLPHCRESVGISEIPGGHEWYKHDIRFHTTTDMTANEIHQLGLNEVKRISIEMEKVRKQVGFDGSLKKFFTHLREDERFYYDSANDLMARYAAMKIEIDAKLPTLFGRLPKADYELRIIEPYREVTATTAHYQRSSADGSRPGVFYVNTYNLKARPKYTMMALSLHEANPGHHFQIAIQQELEDLPRFRRFGSYYNAYIEGWALYAESLGEEMGFYRDPYDYFGKLTYEMWRALRLVVDTGLHAKGWTRQEAVHFMLARSSLTETNINAEVDRYIAWPAQALSYKIGELKIHELRRTAQSELKENFDLKAFHDHILANGSLPLSILEKRTHEWIISRK